MMRHTEENSYTKELDDIKCRKNNRINMIQPFDANHKAHMIDADTTMSLNIVQKSNALLWNDTVKNQTVKASN